MKKRSLKIGFVLDDSLDKADGVQQYILTLGRWFSSQGHDVHYLVGHTKRDDIVNIHSLSRTVGVRFNQNRMSTPLPARPRKIRELLKREKFDVLHVQMPYSPFLAARVINQAPATTAVIGTFHILPYSRLESTATRALGLALKRSLKRFDHIISVSQPAADFARRALKVQSEVIPNAVDVSRYRRAKKLKKYNDGRINIVYLGRLVERKGCMHLLRAVENLHHKQLLDSVRIIIASKGPLEAKLKKFVHAAKLTDFVEFTGFVPEDEKPELLASADIAVLPSTGGESFGIVLVEAMAAGADVVIAGDNPGYASVMGGDSGQLVDPKDTQAFSYLLSHFMHDQAARAEARSWQAERALEYDVRTVGTRLLEVYTDVLRKKHGMR